MSYTNAQYVDQNNAIIRVDIAGVTSTVPCAQGNIDYSRILELVAAGELEIESYVPALPPLVTQISMRQCRLELLNRGLLDQVQLVVDSLGGTAQIEWEYATIVDKSSQLVSVIAANVNPPLSEDQINSMFMFASQR